MTDVEATTQEVQKVPSAPPPASKFPMLEPTESLAFRALAYADNATATDDVSVAGCVSVDKMLLECESRFKSERDEYNAPLIAAKKVLDAKHKTKMDPLAKARTYVKGLIGTFEMARRAEEQRLAKEEQDRLDTKALEEAVQMEDEGHGDVAEGVLEEKADLAQAAGTVQRTGSLRGAAGGSANVNAVWKHEIEEPAYVPRVFCEPSDALIRARLKEWEGLPVDSPERKIPGVRIYQDAKVTTR